MNATTKALLEGLYAHYRKPGDLIGEALVNEVAAPGSSRSCDLLRVGMWPSRGLGIDVHELKISRSDWLRELADPGKADAWWPYCSRFWVVAMPGVVNLGELPKGWGLMVPPTRANARRFKVLAPAAEKAPQVSLELLVTVLRRADNTRLAEIQDLHKAHREELIRQVTEERDRHSGTVSDDARHRLDLLDKLEQAIGTRIERYGWGKGLPLEQVSPEELAAAVRDFAQGHILLQRREKALDTVRRSLERDLQRVLRGLAELEDRGDVA